MISQARLIGLVAFLQLPAEVCCVGLCKFNDTHPIVYAVLERIAVVDRNEVDSLECRWLSRSLMAQSVKRGSNSVLRALAR